MRWCFVFVIALVGCDGGSVVDDAGADVASEAADDGALDAGSPRCVSNGGGSSDPAAVPAFGSFVGANASGDVCLGGAFAVIQNSLLVIETADFGDPTRFFQFQSPPSAVTGSIAIVVGLTSTAPGFQSSSGACGDLGFCAIMPTAITDCGDAAAPSSCPDGCDFVEPGGPCGPATPEECFAATGVSDCAGGATTTLGSWALDLTVATPFTSDASAPELVAHGVFRGTFSSGDAGVVTLTMGF